MNYKKIYEKSKKDNEYIIHTILGEIGLVIDAPSKEEAIQIAKEKTNKLVTTGTCSSQIPKIIKINDEPYKAPPNKVRVGDPDEIED
jgi:hypothetical protein